MTDHDMIQEMIRHKQQAPLAIDASKCALLVVDVQRFFARDDSAFAQVFGKIAPGATDGYFQRVKPVLARIQELQQCFRERHLPVMFCAAGSYTGDGTDLPAWLKDFDELGMRVLGRRPNPTVNDASWHIEDAVAPRPGELVLNKTSSGALASTRLDQILHNMGVNSLVVCGLTTAICVAQTARETADRGFRVVIAEDACTELSQEMHEAALLSFSHVFGQVRTTQALTEFFSNQGSGARELTGALTSA